MVERGYQGTDVDIEKVNSAIDAYVARKGDRIGTHSFVRLVQALEAAADQNANGVPATGKQEQRLRERLIFSITFCVTKKYTPVFPIECWWGFLRQT